MVSSIARYVQNTRITLAAVSEIDITAVLYVVVASIFVVAEVIINMTRIIVVIVLETAAAVLTAIRLKICEAVCILSPHGLASTDNTRVERLLGANKTCY